MMKKVLGIIGSPRRSGNSELAVKEIARNIPEAHELNLIRLTSLDIKPCQACYTCILEDRCPVQDDYHMVLDAMRQADAMIVAAPCYLLGPNASIKLLTDRFLQNYTYLNEIWGKPGITVTVAGIEGQEGYTHVALSIMAKVLGLDIKDNLVLFGALPGEILFKEGYRAKLADLGNTLFQRDTVKEPKNYLCPICLGDSFQFLSNNRIKCMVCRHSGTLSLTDGRLELLIEPGQDVFFMSYEKSMAHKEWLKTMKDRFLAKKDELKKIAQDYKQDGKWIEAKP
jgi:multimeric flavodoxin WrbA